jgi:hypothetical protein
MRMPPGYSSIASTKSLIESKFAFRTMEMTAENLIELGMVVAGSASTVRERLAAYARDLGVGNLIAMLQIATLPAELTEKNLRLFARDVMPFLRGQDTKTAVPMAASA